MQACTANPKDKNPVHSLPHYYFKVFSSSLRCRDNEGCFDFILIPFFKAFLNSTWIFLFYTAVSVSTFLHLSFLSASSPVVSVFTSFYFAPFGFQLSLMSGVRVPLIVLHYFISADCLLFTYCDLTFQVLLARQKA